MAKMIPLVLGQPNHSKKETSLDTWKSFVVTNSGENGYGLLGIARGVGLYGSGGIGVYANSMDGADSYAGYFVGGMVVLGDSTVFHGSAGTAVRSRGGSERMLYSMASPECWFEDFGKAKLVHGRCKVKLDPEFTALVRTQDYHVFLTPEGNCNGLYVARKSATEFEVLEQQAGNKSIGFSYRIVARRKDVKTVRLPKVKLPKVPKFYRSERRRAWGALPNS